jgi:hypothetical protein
LYCGKEGSSLIKRLKSNPAKWRGSGSGCDGGIKLFRPLTDSFKGDLRVRDTGVTRCVDFAERDAVRSPAPSCQEANDVWKRIRLQ